jgi:hypothetical protein
VYIIYIYIYTIILRAGGGLEITWSKIMKNSHALMGVS